MKLHVDKHRSERVLTLGDWIYLKLQPYRQQSINKRVFHNLATKYYGPFRVIERVGKVAYRLELPSSSKIHNVFHVSLLKKKLGDHNLVSGLPPVSDKGEFMLTPLKILDKRMVKKKNKISSEVLV